MKNMIIKLTIIFLIIAVERMPCYANSSIDDYIVKYKVSDGSAYKTAKFSQAKKECMDYKNQTGEKLTYPYVKWMSDVDSGEWERFIYDYSDIFEYGYETYAYGIPAIKFDEFIKNPSKDFLGNNYRTMYARKADTGEELVDEVEYSPMEYTKNSDNITSSMVGVGSPYYDYCYLGHMQYNSIGVETVESFLKNNNINDNVIYSCLVYPYDEWLYNVELVPITWVKTDKNDYFIVSYIRRERDADESRIDYYSSHWIYGESTYPDAKIYTHKEAIDELCFKTGEFLVDNNEADVNVQFCKNTVMIPLRAYAEKLGYNVKWNSNGTVGLAKDNIYLNIEIEGWHTWNLWLLDGDNHRVGLTSTLRYDNSIYFDNGMFYITNEAIQAIGSYGGFYIDIDSDTNIVYAESK